MKDVQATGEAFLKIEHTSTGIKKMKYFISSFLLSWTGLEKTRVFKKKQPSGFLGFFLVFFWFFWVFLGFFCPDERVFRVFSVSRILLGASRL
jgi:hypothetical protein